MDYTQLNEGKRYQIYTLLGNGFTQADAAAQVGGSSPYTAVKIR